MTKFKKIIPALCMLLISAVLMGTSTYAWFSMNTTVSATGMQVTANSDSKFLLISKENSEISAIRTEGKTTVALMDGEKALYPVALEGTDPTAANVWYTGKGTSYTDGTLSGDKTTFENANAAVNGNYLVKHTVYLALSKGSANGGAVTVVGSTFTDNIGGAAKLIVAVGAEIKGTMTAATKATAITIADGISADQVITVDLYFFYDGTNEAIKSSNATALTSAAVNLQFNVA